jgi:hypothetical protein
MRGEADGLQVEQDWLNEEQEYNRTGRAERQNRLYGKHVRLKKEQENKSGCIGEESRHEGTNPCQEKRF